jgi:CRISPR/Cas system-associated endonuclease Cas1
MPSNRPRCDPIPASIRDAIATGAISERLAYMQYASTAGRPYARSTFSLLVRRKAPPTIELETLTCTAALSSWRERANVKPRILSLGPGGGLRAQGGALIAFDGETTLTYTKAAKPPLAIVLSSAGGFVSIEALRLCARAKIAVIALNRAHGLISIMGAGAAANARLIRAQCALEPLPLARVIVAAKLNAMRCAGAVGDVTPFIGGLVRAESVDAVRVVEAQAARTAWPNPPLMKWERGSIPPEYKSAWLARTRVDARGRPKRRARHPVNAMLNAAFSVTAGRLAAYLAARGFAPPIGFLHNDKRGRYSLCWDCIEPLRPAIEARLFVFIQAQRFAASDFVRAPDGSIRLAPSLLSATLNECAPGHAALANAVKWIERLVLSSPKRGERQHERLAKGNIAHARVGLELRDLPLLSVNARGEGG